MTDFLTILIDLILIWAIIRTRRDLFISASAHRIKVENYLSEILTRPFKLPELKKLNGKIDKMYICTKVAEKFAERAFNIASAASLGVVALQKSLSVPKIMTKPVAQRNILAKDEVDRLFTTEGNFDFLRPILSDEELDVLDEIEKDKYKNMKNGVS